MLQNIKSSRRNIL